jgi:hypothetical protein
LPALESSDIRPPSPDASGPDSGHGQKLAGSGQNGLDPARFGWIWQMAGIQPESGNFGRIRPNILANLATATGCYRIPATVAFSPFVIFSCKPNAGKYFRENYFFLK